MAHYEEDPLEELRLQQAAEDKIVHANTELNAMIEFVTDKELDKIRQMYQKAKEAVQAPVATKEQFEAYKAYSLQQISGHKRFCDKCGQEIRIIEGPLE